MNKSLALLTSLLFLPACQTTRTVTLVGMTDYHSHAVPFYSEGEPGQGGVARALAFLREAKTHPDTLVVSGGDTLNKGVPTWSDEYGCVEWPWFNELLDVMALGNHDLDYGAETFERCRAGIQYPLLCANLVRADGAPYFQVEGRPYLVREVGGVRLGFFALAGPDMQRLVKAENLPAGTRWTDAKEAARAMVGALRNEEHVDAVVLIGHQLREDDEALAREVPGIDVIMGSHSHYRGELRVIPGTRTYYLSPYQYLAYLSEVRLHFRGRTLERVEGGLVKLDGSKREDAETAAKVGELQRALVAKRPERFEVLGRLTKPLRDEGLSTGESEVGIWATEVLRRAAGAHAFFATSAGFRAGLPAGNVTVEDFYGAIPYRNVVVTAELTGAQLADWVALSESKAGTDGYSQRSGVRYEVRDGRVEGLQVLKDPNDPRAGYEPVKPETTYRVATTDFQAFVAAGYKEALSKARNVRRTELDVHELLKAALRTGATEAPPRDTASH
ncbi:bifunctional UDP-sugar hydrolase/5'-nucleotidase [Vitiosangium sp. GDMCC 1.1324]|uniref:bifunctional metallophosphatase/5'-nucleotidase n=1 Tax=Vitiosangium sp. (strain GDMCC 1.1324) TaxID=2138576 RepID=UPI000D372CA4|nr:bifunctional UDP-sugar hydrolase/5'-nucleotidase [Vitiosangium sp. GDMCC 1.1324]PTL79485.1 bifunctional metallophosphatase/5'-nucleotidase [Vitiosangium sp. GDMCC 1.1324]